MACAGPDSVAEPCSVRLRNLERRRWWHRTAPVYTGEEGTVCCMSLPDPGRSSRGLPFTLMLPSFSGATPMMPQTLQYTCRLSARIRPVKAMGVAAARGPAGAEGGSDPLRCVLMGRPVVALAFSDMVMSVQEPVPLLSRESAAMAAAACT